MDRSLGDGGEADVDRLAGNGEAVVVGVGGDGEAKRLGQGVVELDALDFEFVADVGVLRGLEELEVVLRPAARAGAQRSG